MACFGSLAFGAKLIARTSPAVIQKLTAGAPAEAEQHAIPTSAPVITSTKPLLVKPKLSPEAGPAGTARATASIRDERERDE
jgi:hypothetical protein